MLAASRPTLFCCIVRLSIYDVPHRIGLAPLPLPIWWLGVLVAHQNSADLARTAARIFSFETCSFFKAPQLATNQHL